jgi:hypothetical protein
MSKKDGNKQSRKSQPSQPRLRNGPLLIRMLIANQGNLGLWPAEAPKRSDSNKDADWKSRKFGSGQPRLRNSPFLIRMLIGNQGNQSLAIRGSEWSVSNKDVKI